MMSTPKLRNAWEKAKKKGTQQAKRDFCYNIFLLDSNERGKKVHFIGGKERAEALRLLPTASPTPIGWVHKTSLEKLQETEKSLYGWMTSFQIAKLQGAYPKDPNFTELEKAAVQGLESRPHEVKA